MYNNSRFNSYFIVLLLNSAILALIKPINLDLIVYSEWILDPGYYSFDPFFNVIGGIFRFFDIDIRGVVFAISLCLQYMITIITLRIFPAVNLTLMVIVGATAFWHITLSSNVLRQGMACIIFLMPFVFFSNKNLFAKYSCLLLAILTHWSMAIFGFIYYFFNGGVFNHIFLKVVFIFIVIAFFPFVENYFDISGKIMFYARTELFDETRSSQIPRFLMQFSLLLLGYYFKIIPGSLRSYVFVIAMALIFSVGFPEMFSRISLASGIFLHIAYYGFIFSSKKISFNLKFSICICAVLVQLMHPSTRVLLEL